MAYTSKERRPNELGATRLYFRKLKEVLRQDGLSAAARHELKSLGHSFVVRLQVLFDTLDQMSGLGGDHEGYREYLKRENMEFMLGVDKDGLARLKETLNPLFRRGRHKYGLQVIDLILEQYPEVFPQFRDVVQPGKWNWDWDAALVKIEPHNRGEISLYINQERIRNPKVRNYLVEAALDDRVLDKYPDEIDHRLQTRSLSRAEHLGSISTVLCLAIGYGDLQFIKQTPQLESARSLAGRYGFTLRNIDDGFITLYACDIRPETVKRFVQAVKQYEREVINNQPNQQLSFTTT